MNDLGLLLRVSIQLGNLPSFHLPMWGLLTYKKDKEQLLRQTHGIGEAPA